MKIVVLDSATLGADIDLSPLAAHGELTVYQSTTPDEVATRLADADVAVLNKIKINKATLPYPVALKLICVTATGFDNIDLGFCRERGIAVCNVVGYSTQSVAQVTLGMALSLFLHLPAYREQVAGGAYTAGDVANSLVPVYHELAGKTWGVVGLGHIGKRVAELAHAFGCRVIAFKRTPDPDFECCSLEQLCRESDIISVHLPLSPSTRGILSAREISLMKRDAILINVARGAVVDEAALASAVKEKRIGGIGIDVYSAEPLAVDHPLYELRHLDNVLLTPHMAWGAKEARDRCIAEIAQNIAAFLAQEPRNRID